MQTLAKLDRLWNQKRFRQLLRDLVVARPEGHLQIDVALPGPESSAAIALLRLTELHQRQSGLADKLIRHLLFAQQPDGSWKLPALLARPIAAHDRRAADTGREAPDLMPDAPARRVSGNIGRARPAKPAARPAAKSSAKAAAKTIAGQFASVMAGLDGDDRQIMLTSLVLRSLEAASAGGDASWLAPVARPGYGRVVAGRMSLGNEVNAGSGQSDEIAKAIARGRDWLASNQHESGRWGSGGAGGLIASGFVLLQLGRSLPFQSAVDFDAAMGWLEQTDDAILSLSEVERVVAGAVASHARMRVGSGLRPVRSAMSMGSRRQHDHAVPMGRNGVARESTNSYLFSDKIAG